MKRRTQDVQLLVFGVLAPATDGSWLLGFEQTGNGTPIIGAAVFKLRLVGIHFMEIGSAPIALRTVFEVYVGVTMSVLVVLFLVI